MGFKLTSRHQQPINIWAPALLIRENNRVGTLVQVAMQRAASGHVGFMSRRQECYPLRLPVDGNVGMSRAGISIAELDGYGIATSGALDVLESDSSPRVASDVTSGLAPAALAAGDDDGIIAERGTLTLDAGLTRSL